MSDMDEILFWVHTRQAPCLMNFDNVIKKQNEANYSSGRPRSPRSSLEEVHSPKKKKKRKLSELDEESTSPEKQKNLFFETSQQNKKAIISICRSDDTADSDIDFNIKDSSVQYKSKRMRLQKSSRTALHRKNKVFTSTPKVTTALRRSRRRTQHINYNTDVNITFQPMDTTNNYRKPGKKPAQDKFLSGEIIINGSRAVNNVKQTTIKDEIPKLNQAVPNGQFEDLSDVSGFTANYIRSTKLQSTRTPRNLRNKGGRNLVKESRQITKQEDNEVLVCVNKPVNTSKGSKAVALNCSSDSSQNILNITSLKNKKGNVKKVDTSTSALKFLEAKVQKKIDIDEMNGKLNNKSGCVNVNIPIKPRSTSRYPRRHKDTTTNTNDFTTDTSTDQSPDKRKSLNIKSSTLNDSDRKENPGDSISRTRSGRPIGLRVREPSNSVLVVNNSTERASTVTVNVAVATDKDLSTGNLGNSKKSRNSSGVKYVQRAADSSTPAQALAPRDRSGYKQCFSDSDESEPPKERKFFC